MAISPQIGTLYGIGVGPGDSDLISVKGLNRLQNCPIVAYPAGLQGKPGIAEQIISPWLSSQYRLPLIFPYVQEPEQLNEAWQRAAKIVWKFLGKGQDIAFACEGDIGMYSTFTYLADTLINLHPQALIQRIPGISSPMAAAAALNVPLTYQRDRLAILPTLQRLENLTEALTWADVVVLFKVSSVYPQVWQVLKQHNLLQSSSIVIRASTAEQEIYHNLEQYPDLELPYFSLLIITKPTGSKSSSG
ncbi:precorrin-2 C(20)-methyltransferase [Acaryochloris marina]|uniref:Precorrin-2 C20-methyltransferase n=1 Tax=Acaryochloris marina (strain MBIC 11017) TaxID=329726 RepID=B0CDD7_ACAM1|nr:precorrin-2 C20-methyltransferase [Acaryochloris marina MBIC11017]